MDRYDSMLLLYQSRNVRRFVFGASRLFLVPRDVVLLLYHIFLVYIAYTLAAAAAAAAENSVHIFSVL